MEQTGRYDVAMLGDVTKEVDLNADTVRNLNGAAAGIPSGWYWLIGAEVALLVVLQILISMH